MCRQIVISYGGETVEEVETWCAQAQAAAAAT
jgi:hypothetical protein